MKKKFIFAAVCSALLLSACSKEVENEPLEISLASEKYTGTFEGEVKEDCFSGTFTGMDGLVYHGDIINNCISGKGKIEGLAYTLHERGRQIEGIYSGDINNSAITGSGQFASNDKAFLYEGGFKDGMLKGAGKLKDNAYLVNFSEVDRVGQYEGDTIDGLADRQGTFSAVNTYNEPYTYQGDWKQGLFHGYGSFLDEEFSYKKFEKNPAKFGNKLIDLKRLQVVQISEVEYSEYLPVVTTIIASNSNNIYWIYYIGGCDDVYAGSTIEAYLLPLGYGSYTTLLGTSRTAMAAAAAMIR